MASGINDLWTKTGSFIHKPATGWLHPDQVIRGTGKRYIARYMGCLQILASMREMHFDIRSQVAKESIRMVCQRQAMKNKLLEGMLGPEPLLKHADEEVAVTVKSSGVTLTLTKSGDTLVGHDIANISFASGGESRALVAYVGKDVRYGRACFVLLCSSELLAHDLITTLGQAFELRFKDFLYGDACNDYYNKTFDAVPPSPPLPDYTSENGEDIQKEGDDTSCEPHYANGKLPCLPPPLPQHRGTERDLNREPWFHGTISRKESELFVTRDGEFLVRESRGSPGQYVLTGMMNGTHKHLLLVDPEGVVRTKYMTFKSVTHLVDFHREHNLPILSSESRLYLQQPALRSVL